ncbi:MAG: exo-alpha-sialidase [Acidimicrobiales bacterium]|jgi:hypothetical protein|nr:exo-alpha-sialidase [Acidimicrobiales bacterium]
MARRTRALGGIAGVAAFAALIGGPARATAPVAAPFRAPVVISDIDTGEPGVDIATDGTIYVNAPASVFAPSYVWRSGDGAHWVLTPAGARATAPGGGDSDIAVDPQGVVYMTDLYLGSAAVSSSTNRAQTWTTNAVQGTLVQDRQWIATTGRGVVYHVTHQFPTGLVVTKSTNGGRTFLSSTVAATPLDQTGCECQPGTMVALPGVAAGGDKVGVIYATSTGGMKFARSTNGAATFKNVTVSPPSSADTTVAMPVVASRGGDDLVAVWQETFAAGSRVQLSRSGDFGRSWTPPVTIVSGGTSLYPWVDGRGGKVAVSLYHTDAVRSPDLMPKGTPWYETYLESTDGGATFTATRVLDAIPVKTGPICTAGVTCESNRELLDFQSVAIDPAGRANVAWTRSIDNAVNTEIRFARQL